MKSIFFLIYIYIYIYVYIYIYIYKLNDIKTLVFTFVHKCLGVYVNISDLVLKQIYDIYETNNLSKEEIKKYKMTRREIFEK